MAGGQGTRLYPLSTPEKPKQFLDLAGRGRTLIQLTCDRFSELDPEARFWVVTAADYVPLVREQLPQISEEQIIAEPVQRNTAPCIALACRKIKARFPDAAIAVTPSDAYVPDGKAFAATLAEALNFASGRRAIVTVGISPTSPHTGYGYIEKGSVVSGNIHKVLSFKEKPSGELAEKYLSAGTFLWNAGIFVWNTGTIEEELRLHAPSLAALMDSIEAAFGTPDEPAVLARLFPQAEKISIDYALLEKSDCVYTIGADWAWSDLGSFEAIEAVTGRQIPRSIKDAQAAYQAAKLACKR